MSLLVFVPVVDVRVVRMMVNHPLMPVGVGVRLGAIPGACVLMPVMLVMHMAVRVLERLMDVLMLVALADVQPDAGRDQRQGSPEQIGRAHV